jgi:transposase
MDGLAAPVRENLGADPDSGVIYVFRAKRADRVKLLLWDGTGLVLISKRLGARAASDALIERHSNSGAIHPATRTP